MSRQAYVRSDELQDAIVALVDLPRLFNVDERTVRRWIAADAILTFPNPVQTEGHSGGQPLAVRWGDVPIGKHPTRWRRRKSVR